MRLFAQAFWLPKSGSTDEEYEDAYSPRQLPSDREVLVSSFKVAVADGATETSFSGLWAKLLARSYVRGELSQQQFGASLRRLQERWRKEVSRKPLPWYGEEKVRRGAAAAFVGLHLLSSDVESYEGNWEAIALGDCCLVQIRGAEVVERFPIKSAGEFSNSPFLLSSNASIAEGWEDYLRVVSGSWMQDDSFYLMSDALAAWFMREEENGGTPWDILRDLGASQSLTFAAWIRELRGTLAIRNDDVTLVRVDL